MVGALVDVTIVFAVLKAVALDQCVFQRLDVLMVVVPDLLVIRFKVSRFSRLAAKRCRQSRPIWRQPRHGRAHRFVDVEVMVDPVMRCGL